MSQHFYADGATHNDHHKEINIGSVTSSDLKDIVKGFFEDDDVEDAEVMGEHLTSNGQTTSDDSCLAETNVIFNMRILTMEAHYEKVREVLLRFIKQDGVISDVEQITHSAQNEWYYIMKGIRESGIASGSMSDTKFAEQMVAWFPKIFAEKIGEGDSKVFVRNFAKSISAERNNYWTEGVERKEIAIIDMHAHAHTRQITGKAKHAYPIANGLKRALEEMKTEIKKAQNAKR